MMAEQGSESMDQWCSDYHDWTPTIKEKLKSVFGLDGFREKQLSIVTSTLEGKDVMVLMPTGGGKSLTYQLPAVCAPGFTVVVSPLLSLIRDQVDYLNSRSVVTQALTSDTGMNTARGINNDIRSGSPVIKLLYVTPERVMNPQFQQNLQCALDNNMLQRFVIDECHCLSQWGSNFRPDYTALGILREKFPKVPIMALTATATENVKIDIITTLNMPPERLTCYQTSFHRKNLMYKIISKAPNKTVTDMFNRLRLSRLLETCGIIYCFSRAECETVSAELNKMYMTHYSRNGNQRSCRFAAYYHAQSADRDIVQKMWMEGEVKIICATIAFGMGINKANVRFVYHHTMPKSIEAYYQESGRAGRDGELSECAIYYSKQDKNKIVSILTDQSQTNEDRNKKGYGNVTKTTVDDNLRALDAVVRYCEDAETCRHKLQLAHFGEEFDDRICKGMCDNCTSKQDKITSFFPAKKADST